MGVTFALAENTFLNNIYYGLWDTIDFSVSIIDNLKMLFSGQVSADQLMGPIGISEVVSKTDGLVEFIYLLALISLSLRSNKPSSIPTTRWRKNSFINNRRNKKKTIKREYRNRYTNGRILFAYRIINICSI